MGFVILNFFCNKLTLFLMFYVNYIKTEQSTILFDSKPDQNPEETNDMLITDVKTLLQLNPTDLRIKTLDENFSLDVTKLLSIKGVYMFNDAYLTDFYAHFTNFLRVVG